MPAAGGSVRLEGRDLTRATPRQRLRAGVGYIPEDRQEDGLVAGFSVADNLILDVYDQPPYSSGIALDLDRIRATAAERVADFDIRTTSTATAAGTLSGGNQQKVILAREIGREVRLLVASQPTRGLDVGSIEFVHRRIVEERDQGVAVLIISSELDEIYALSDRIAVMYEGKITGFRDPDVAAEELGMLMAGAADADAAASAATARAWARPAPRPGLMASGLLGVGVPEAEPPDGPPDGGPAEAGGRRRPLVPGRPAVQRMTAKRSRNERATPPPRRPRPSRRPARLPPRAPARPAAAASSAGRCWTPSWRATRWWSRSWPSRWPWSWAAC